MRLALIFILACFSHLAMSQDLTGIWRGSFISSDRFQSMFNSNDRYKLEVQIDQRGKEFNSVTYSYKTTMFYGKAASYGTVNPKTGKVFLEETKIVEVKMSYGSSACIMTYKLNYSKNGDEEFMEGTWIGYNENDSSFCNKGTVILRKVTTTDFYKEPFLVRRELELKKKSPVLKKLPAPVAKTGIAKKPAEKMTAQSPVKIPSTTTAKTATATVKAPATSSTKKPLAMAAKTPAKTTPLSTTVPKVSTIPKPAPKSTDVSSKPKPVTNKNTPQNSIARVPKPIKPVTIAPAKPSTPELIAQDAEMKETPVPRKAPMVIPRVLTTRENELLKTIIVNHQNEITINIYDNGTIDHDTVSVYLDKKLVISKQMLTTSPLTVKFSLDETNSTHEIIMVAENLGDFPPNTSLMVVKAGDKEYEVRITSNEQKNAVVLFKLEEK